MAAHELTKEEALQIAAASQSLGALAKVLQAANMLGSHALASGVADQLEAIYTRWALVQSGVDPEELARKCGLPVGQS